jgi:transcriptional regulator with XRE-family HTH domain
MDRQGQAMAVSAAGASMGTIQAAAGRHAAALDYQQAGPTALRMLVGSELRRLREAAGVTAKDAGYAIRGSYSKISRLELGRTSFKLRDVADLLTLYGVSGDADRDALLALARQANVPGWWHPYADLLPGWFEDYLGLEQAARIIRCYEVQFVPGLLQTEDYARAVIGLRYGGPVETERRVRLRMQRQQIFRRQVPTQLWAVIDEAALRRPYGGRATMRAQLRQLIEVAAHPHITVAVVPFSTGGHAAAGGPVTILRFAEARIPDVAYLEQLNSACYADKAPDIDFYQHVMNRLAVEADPPAATAAILHRILQET